LELQRQKEVSLKRELADKAEKDKQRAKDEEEVSLSVALASGSLGVACIHRADSCRRRRLEMLRPERLGGLSF